MFECDYVINVFLLQCGGGGHGDQANFGSQLGSEQCFPSQIESHFMLNVLASLIYCK